MPPAEGFVRCHAAIAAARRFAVAVGQFNGAGDGTMRAPGEYREAIGVRS
jgi:hypothetical protein